VVGRAEGYPGGKGANAAVAAARLLGKGRVAFIGAVGDDGKGAALRESLRSEGVLTDGLAVTKGAESGRAFVVVNESGAKQIHTMFGANDSLAPRHLLSPFARSALSACAATVIMDVPLPAAVQAARASKSAGARVFYSPGVRIGSGGSQLLQRAIELADHVILDSSELSHLTSEHEPRRALLKLRRRYPRLVMVATLGSSGCLVTSGRSVLSVPPFDLGALGLRPVNSTGSGDAFLAAYTCYALSGASSERAAKWGNLAGALKAASSATRGSPTRDELESTMKNFEGVRERPLGSPLKRVSSRSRPRS
jgi:ribokinase